MPEQSKLPESAPEAGDVLHGPKGWKISSGQISDWTDDHGWSQSQPPDRNSGHSPEEVVEEPA